MEPRTRWTLLGLAAGIALAGAAFVFAGRAIGTGGTGSRGDADDPDDDARIARLDQRLRSIERTMHANGGAPRAERPVPVGTTPRPDPAAPAPDPAAERAATVAEVEEYLARRLRDEDDRPAPEHRFELGVGDAGTKSLDDAAAELKLRPEQVRQVRDAFRLEGVAQLRAVFGSDDIDAIRMRIRDAQTDPEARTKLQDDLLGNLLRSLPRIRRAEEEKVRALTETLGAEGYERFRRLGVRESDVDEFDALFEQTFAEADAAPR